MNPTWKVFRLPAHSFRHINGRFSFTPDVTCSRGSAVFTAVDVNTKELTYGENLSRVKTFANWHVEVGFFAII